MIFKIGDSVKGKSGTELEFATGVVIDIDTSNNTVEVNIETHEFDDDYVGDETWIDADDLVLERTLGITTFTGTAPEADISKLTSVSTMDLFLLGII